MTSKQYAEKYAGQYLLYEDRAENICVPAMVVGNYGNLVIIGMMLHHIPSMGIESNQAEPVAKRCTTLVYTTTELPKYVESAYLDNFMVPDMGCFVKPESLALALNSKFIYVRGLTQPVQVVGFDGNGVYLGNPKDQVEFDAMFPHTPSNGLFFNKPTPVVVLPPSTYFYNDDKVMRIWVPPTKNTIACCTCPTRDLMYNGCTCGAIKRYGVKR